MQWTTNGALRGRKSWGNSQSSEETQWEVGNSQSSSLKLKTFQWEFPPKSVINTTLTSTASHPRQQEEKIEHNFPLRFRCDYRWKDGAEKNKPRGPIVLWFPIQEVQKILSLSLARSSSSSISSAINRNRDHADKTRLIEICWWLR